MYRVDNFSKRQGFNYPVTAITRTWRSNQPPRVWNRINTGFWQAVAFILFDYAHTPSTRSRHW